MLLRRGVFPLPSEIKHVAHEEEASSGHRVEEGVGKEFPETHDVAQPVESRRKRMMSGFAGQIVSARSYALRREIAR
jgi:hypothetical protein